MIPLERGYTMGEVFFCGVLPQYEQMKQFSNGRRFFVFIYGCVNAMGLYGPENNGIAIGDDNNKTVLLDGHCVASTGYFGPTAEQIREYNRILEMNWQAFVKFVNASPRSRYTMVSKNKMTPRAQAY